MAPGLAVRPSTGSAHPVTDTSSTAAEALALGDGEPDAVAEAEADGESEPEGDGSPVDLGDALVDDADGEGVAVVEAVGAADATALDDGSDGADVVGDDDSTTSRTRACSSTSGVADCDATNASAEGVAVLDEVALSDALGVPDGDGDATTEADGDDDGVVDGDAVADARDDDADGLAVADDDVLPDGVGDALGSITFASSTHRSVIPGVVSSAAAAGIAVRKRDSSTAVVVAIATTAGTRRANMPVPNS